MKTKLPLILALCLAASPVLAADKAPQTTEQKVSYSLGFHYGSVFKSQNVPVDTETFLQGMKDAQAGEKGQMTPEEMQQTLENFAHEMQAKEIARIKALADKNQAESKKFLDENKAKAGVKTLPSGLQYRVLTAGKGKTPKLGDTVTVNFQARLMNGTVFDDTYKRGEPATFPVEGLIKGWQEALQLMKEGDKWELTVPPELAFGAQGAGNTIEPNSAVVFDLELVKVAPAPAKPQAPEKPGKGKTAKDKKEAK